MSAEVNQAPQNDEYWRCQLAAASLERETPIPAQTFLRGYRTKACPVMVQCADGQDYMVKGQQAGRQIVNDQIVARLGILLGAPVGKPRLIEIPAELIAIEPRLLHILPGSAHGTLFIPNCFDQYKLIATSQPENRPRLARLAVLYGWVVPGDWQFLFDSTPPRLIHSVDHGHFFPGGPDWSTEDLQLATTPCMPECFQTCELTPDELADALGTLSAISEQQIVQVVASPPDEWGLTIEERILLVKYLLNRQRELPTTFESER